MQWIQCCAASVLLDAFITITKWWRFFRKVVSMLAFYAFFFCQVGACQAFLRCFHKVSSVSERSNYHKTEHDHRFASLGLKIIEVSSAYLIQYRTWGSANILTCWAIGHAFKRSPWEMDCEACFLNEPASRCSMSLYVSSQQARNNFLQNLGCIWQFRCLPFKAWWFLLLLVGSDMQLALCVPPITTLLWLHWTAWHVLFARQYTVCTSVAVFVHSFISSCLRAKAWSKSSSLTVPTDSTRQYKCLVA